MTSRQPGPWLFALGMIGLGLAQVVFQACLPGLKPLPAGWEPAAPAAMVVGAVLALAGAGLLLPKARRWAGLGVAAFWMIWFVIGHIAALAAAPSDVTLWVSTAQVLVFAAIGLMLARPDDRVAEQAARVILAATLILFGAVHWLYPAAIAGMIPGWMPMAGVWPWITGGIQLVGGLMILTGFRAPLAAFAVGAMWLAWIPLVHAARVLEAPGDLFEWTFVLTALSLAGAAWSAGERLSARIPSES